jgi:uncharacterized RDD family membrane protein YckC
MSYHAIPLDDDYLTEGVLLRRVFAWLIDVLLIGLIWIALTLGLVLFGLLTLGLGLPMLGILPFVPFCYHVLFLAGPPSATPGQSALGLVVRRNDDFGRPTPAQAVVSTLLFYASLAFSGLPLLLALFTVRRRTPHDLISGLVVVRTRALTRGLGSWNMPGGSPYA